MSVQRRTVLTAALFASVLIAAATAGWQLHTRNHDRAVALFQDQQLHTAQVIAATLHAEINGLARSLRVVAGGIAHERAPRVLQERLDRQLACVQSPCFSSVAVYDDTTTALYGMGRGVGIDSATLRSSIEWAVDVENDGGIRTVISAAAAPALVLLTPVAAVMPSVRPALLAGEVDLDALFFSHRRIQQSRMQRTVLVLDSDGNVVFHSQHPEMRLNNVRKRTSRCYSCHQNFDYIDRMIDERQGVVEYNLRGVPHLAAFAPLEVSGQAWLAAVMGPTDNAVGVLLSEGRQLTVIMTATVIALGFVVHATWKSGRRRLRAEAEAIRREHLEHSHRALTALNARLESAALEWRSTVDTIDAALVVLAPSGDIERMNRAAANMLPGEPFSWLNQPSERLNAHQPWDAALSLARDAVDRDTISTARVHYADSGRTWDLWCRTAQRTGRRGSVVIVARDVTAVVELQESLRRSETMAALGSLVAGVAHEVRTPLFAISSLVDAWTLKQRGEATPFQDALRREVLRLKLLMNELLEYGTPTRSDPQPHQLAPVIHEAVRSCEADAESRNVRIATRAPVDAEVWIDPDRFVRVLINLIQNAVQHAPEGSDVSVDVAVSRRKPPVLEVAVRDRGPGFRDEDLSRVFTPFFSRRVGGFGLGLAICERIVSEHHATMLAANHPDGGAVVSVLLPLVETKPEAVACEGVRTC